MVMTVGFEQARIGIYGTKANQFLDGFKNETIDPENIFVLDNKVGAPQGFNITNMNYTATAQYGGDGIYRLSGKGHGAITATFTSLDIPPEILGVMIGMEYVDGIYKLGKDTKAPYCSVELMSHDTDNKAVYMSLVKGIFQRTAINPQTNQAQETDATDSLTFTASDRFVDGQTFGEGFEADTNFKLETWEKFVFPKVETEKPTV